MTFFYRKNNLLENQTRYYRTGRFSLSGFSWLNRFPFVLIIFSAHDYLNICLFNFIKMFYNHFWLILWYSLVNYWYKMYLTFPSRALRRDNWRVEGGFYSWNGFSTSYKPFRGTLWLFLTFSSALPVFSGLFWSSPVFGGLFSGFRSL